MVHCVYYLPTRRYSLECIPLPRQEVHRPKFFPHYDAAGFPINFTFTLRSISYLTIYDYEYNKLSRICY